LHLTVASDEEEEKRTERVSGSHRTKPLSAAALAGLPILGGSGRRPSQILIDGGADGIPEDAAGVLFLESLGGPTGFVAPAGSGERNDGERVSLFRQAPCRETCAVLA
jgi:hypothetical protein